MISSPSLEELEIEKRRLVLRSTDNQNLHDKLFLLLTLRRTTFTRVLPTPDTNRSIILLPAILPLAIPTLLVFLISKAIASLLFVALPIVRLGLIQKSLEDALPVSTPVALLVAQMILLLLKPISLGFLLLISVSFGLVLMAFLVHVRHLLFPSAAPVKSSELTVPRVPVILPRTLRIHVLTADPVPVPVLLSRPKPLIVALTLARTRASELEKLALSLVTSAVALSRVARRPPHRRIIVDKLVLPTSLTLVNTVVDLLSLLDSRVNTLDKFLTLLVSVASDVTPLPQEP